MTEPFSIEPDAIYDDGALVLALGLTLSALAAARRKGTLRYTRQGKRTLYMGAWVLTWLDDESSPAAPAVANDPERAEVAR